MSASQHSQKTASFVGILGAFLVVAVLIYVMKSYTTPAPLNQARAVERKTALKEMRDSNSKAAAGYDWVDQGKGIVRLKVDRAMELTIQDYRNPAAARSNLIARAAKATAVPPKAPEAPNQFE